MPAIFVTNFNGSNNHFRKPLRSAPIMSIAFFNDIVESFANFFERSFKVRSMRENNVDIFKLKVVQRLFNSFEQMFSGISNLIYSFKISPKQLCSHHQVLSICIQSFQNFSENFFCLSCSVDFCCVEKIDPRFPSLVHYLFLSF